MKEKLTRHLSSTTITSPLPREAELWVTDEILWLLKDGRWHELGEIVKKCSLPESKAEMAVSFLSEYGFIEVNKNGRKARLRPLMLKFINEIQYVEKKEAFTS